MMRMDAVKDMIMTARRDEAVAHPFPSGVAAGDNRAGFLNASEAGRCMRQLWYMKHGVTDETHLPYGVFDRGHAFEHWAVTYLAAGLANIGGRLLYAGAQQRRLMLPTERLADAGRADRMEQPIGDGARSEIARRRVQLRRRPVRDARPPGRAEYRTVP
jgi:hypothetical protein